MDEDRLKHSIAVARKMVEFSKIKKLGEEDIKNCFIIGSNHDVGYDERLEDIKNRYGKDFEIYNKYCKIVDKIRR
ncbi:MAG: hypothetical protein MR598_07350 [Erysipelotrichaceae bacterium]|nr:hypothetical protein [Erysipelotrichaceae bacterium]